jgi:hypothetical protein
VKSSKAATRSYFDALAAAERRACSAEERLAAIERMLVARRPDAEILAALDSKASLPRRLMRVASHTVPLAR